MTDAMHLAVSLVIVALGLWCALAAEGIKRSRR